MDRADVTEGLPAELAVALQDHSIVVPQDASVFALIAQWADAPSATSGLPEANAASEISVGSEVSFEAVSVGSSTTTPTNTPAAC